MADSSVAGLVGRAGGVMNGYLKYSDLIVGGNGESNKEFLRGDLWEFEFTSAPRIVYFPGSEIFNKRLTQINIGIDNSVNGFEKRLRGNFSVYQQTGQQTAGTLALNFVDREDQAITYFLDDWHQKIADRDTKYSFRKEDLIAECKLTFLNSSRIAVRTLTFFNCILTDRTFDENGVAEDGTDRADIQMTMKFEHFQREFNNI